MNDHQGFEHDEIEAHQLVELYVLGRLTAPEAERFEAHFVGCQQCLDELEAAERLAGGIKVLARPTADPSLAAPAGSPSRFFRFSRSRLFTALAAGLIAALLPGGFALLRMRALGHEVASLRSAAAEAQTRVQTLENEIARREVESATGRERETRLNEALAAATRPQPNVPLVFLGPVRAGSNNEAPAHRLVLPAPPGWVVLALEIDGPAEASYRASLRREDTTAMLLTQEGLHLNEMGALTLSLHSSTLATGDYLVEARDEAGSARARFRFRLEPAASP